MKRKKCHAAIKYDKRKSSQLKGKEEKTQLCNDSNLKLNIIQIEKEINQTVVKSYLQIIREP